MFQTVGVVTCNFQLLCLHHSLLESTFSSQFYRSYSVTVVILSRYTGSDILLVSDIALLTLTECCAYRRASNGKIATCSQGWLFAKKIGKCWQTVCIIKSV